jgi:mycothione reductase
MVVMTHQLRNINNFSCRRILLSFLCQLLDGYMISDANNFDLIVIGSGSGLDVAKAAAEKGLKVALIEKDRMGGTCLNRGCIPSKLLIHSADIMEDVKRSDIFGINIKGNISVDFKKIVSRVNTFVDSASEEIREAYHSIDNPKLFFSNCRFIGTKKLLLQKEVVLKPTSTSISSGNYHRSSGGMDNIQTVTAEKILVASGSRPRIPNIKGLAESGFITSNDALRLEKQPDILTIIGGGYICCEFAHFFGSLGTKINIIQLRDRLIPYEDEEVSQKLTDIFSKKYNVYLGSSTETITRKNKNNKGDVDNHNVETANDSSSTVYNVTIKNDAGRTVCLESDQLLLAAGRVPNSDVLDIGKTGVKVDDGGHIVTDEYLETNIQGIFALGDVVGRYQFKHSANLEALYAYHNIVHQDDKVSVDYAVMPHAIFTSPQIAGVGTTEQSLKSQGKIKDVDYLKSVYPYINTGMGRAIEDNEGFVKFLVDKQSRKILGCHIIGTDASILIHEVLVAMKASDMIGKMGTIDNITRTVHVHPALSEVVARAASQI